MEQVEVDYLAKSAGMTDLSSFLVTLTALRSLVRDVVAKAQRRSDEDRVTICSRDTVSRMNHYSRIAGHASCESLELHTHTIEGLHCTPSLLAISVCALDYSL
jgi:hypothetical protein